MIASSHFYCPSQVDAQLLVVQKLEEKEGVLQSTLATLEKELALRTQALELNKRKVNSERSQTPTSVLMSMTTMTQLNQPLVHISRCVCVCACVFNACLSA